MVSTLVSLWGITLLTFRFDKLLVSACAPAILFKAD